MVTLAFAVHRARAARFSHETEALACVIRIITPAQISADNFMDMFSSASVSGGLGAEPEANHTPSLVNEILPPPPLNDTPFALGAPLPLLSSPLCPPPSPPPLLDWHAP